MGVSMEVIINIIDEKKEPNPIEAKEPSNFKKINPFPNNQKILQKKINIKVNPNLSLGINWQGPTFNCLVKANADENNEEAKQDQKNQCAKNGVRIRRGPPMRPLFFLHFVSCVQF